MRGRDAKNMNLKARKCLREKNGELRKRAKILQWEKCENRKKLNEREKRETFNVRE